MSVGTFLFLGILHDVAFVRLEERVFSEVGNHLLKLIAFILFIAFIVASFHLGNPVNAVNSLNNLESSWLSREILSIILFTISGGIFLFIYKKYSRNKKLVFTFALFTTLLGFIAIASMSMIYMLKTVPVWNNVFTPISFYLSALLLGSGVMFYSLIRIMRRRFFLTALDESSGEKLNYTLNFLLVVITFLLFLNLTITFIQIIFLGSGNDPLKAGYNLLIEENLFFIIVKVILLIIVLTLSFLIIKHYRLNKSLFELYKYSTLYFILILIIELIGRYLFYASYHRIGV
jgi:anaerobic dimethyl sulfoxide reductase subunit C (anchor subunit)